MKICIKYIDYKQFLKESEWKDMIINNISKIIETDIGKILIDEIDKYIELGYSLSFLNYSNSKLFQYPHCCKVNDKKINIIIPDTPYFINVPTFNYELIKNFESNCSIDSLINGTPQTKILDNSFIKCFSTYQFQPICVAIFHELVHCLRIIKNFNSNSEEESTIYGIINDTVKIENFYITENNFRKELNLNMRMSHDSEYFYVDGVNNKFELPKEYLKTLFTRLII